MSPRTLPDLVSSLRARALDRLGAAVGSLLFRLPLPVLLRLERWGVPGLGWAIFARDMERRDP